MLFNVARALVIRYRPMNTAFFMTDDGYPNDFPIIHMSRYIVDAIDYLAPSTMMEQP